MKIKTYAAAITFFLFSCNQSSMALSICPSLDIDDLEVKPLSDGDSLVFVKQNKSTTQYNGYTLHWRSESVYSPGVPKIKSVEYNENSTPYCTYKIVLEFSSGVETNTIEIFPTGSVTPSFGLTLHPADVDYLIKKMQKGESPTITKGNIAWSLIQSPVRFPSGRIENVVRDKSSIKVFPFNATFEIKNSYRIFFKHGKIFRVVLSTQSLTLHEIEELMNPKK